MLSAPLETRDGGRGAPLGLNWGGGWSGKLRGESCLLCLSEDWSICSICFWKCCLICSTVALSFAFLAWYRLANEPPLCLPKVLTGLDWRLSPNILSVRTGRLSDNARLNYCQSEKEDISQYLGIILMKNDFIIEQNLANSALIPYYWALMNSLTAKSELFVCESPSA